MIFDESLPEFAPGGLGPHLPNKLSPPGLPSLSAVLADPLAPSNRMPTNVKSWELSSTHAGVTTSWKPKEDEAMSSSPKFIGEQSLLPDVIPDELWQSHFRQNDPDLSDRRETEFLLQLYKQTSGRWPVIFDRWQVHPVYGLRGKSVESLKSKFNKVAMKLLEIDAIQRRKPTNAAERMQATQHLKHLPIFAMKYNEKNEYLRRLFLETAFKRPRAGDVEKLENELIRGPLLAMKKKQQSKVPVLPGPSVSSSLVPVVQSEISVSEYNRVKSVLSGLGVDRAQAVRTPRLAKLLATIEKEAVTLLFMRDSLLRKKQELDILRSSGGVNGGGIRLRPPVSAPGGAAPPAMNAAQSAQSSAAMAQQKRKRQ